MRWFLNCLLRGKWKALAALHRSPSQPSIWLCFFGTAPFSPSPPCSWKLIPGSYEHPTLRISSLCPEKWGVCEPGPAPWTREHQ